MRIAICFLLLNLFSYTAFAEEPHIHWSYEGRTGPEKWGTLAQSFHVCEEGQQQSPIDIVQTVQKKLPPIKVSYYSVPLHLLNNGHTIQVNIPLGNTMRVEDATYQLVQFHFHTPSEYHINGVTYPLEMHLVHKRADGKLAVIGVMFKEGDANTELEKIWQHLPREHGKKLVVKEVVLDIKQLLPEKLSYYRFTGSLTTPPCSEGVNWMVLQQPVTASKAQIETFRKFFAMNARPIQSSNKRIIIKGIE